MKDGPFPQSFNPSTFQPFNLSTLQPFNPSTFQPFNLSTLQPFNPSTFQPFADVQSGRGRDARGAPGKRKTSEMPNVFRNLTSSALPGSRPAEIPAMHARKLSRHFRGCGILPRHGGWRVEECLTQSPPSPTREREGFGKENPRGDAEGLESAFAQKDKRKQRDGWSAEVWAWPLIPESGPLFLRGRFWKCEAPPWKNSVSPFSARSVFCATGRGERGAGGLVPWAGGAYLIRIRGRSFFIARLFPNPHCSGCARCRGWSGRCAFRRGGGRGGRRAKGKRDGWFGGRDGG